MITTTKSASIQSKTASSPSSPIAKWYSSDNPSASLCLFSVTKRRYLILDTASADVMTYGTDDISEACLEYGITPDDIDESIAAFIGEVNNKNRKG